MNILCIDIGTTSMRGILFSDTGSIKGIKSILTPLIYNNGWIEQDPQVYVNGLLDILDHIHRFGDIDAISLTSLRSVPTLCDASGSALTNFIMWQDTRNTAICKSLSVYNGEIYTTTGSSVNAVFTGSKLTWMKENMPEIYNKAYKALIVPDYLLHYMTGSWTTDATYGSRSNLMNLKTCTWDKRMLELFRVDEDKLPDIIQPGIAGTTTASFARESGIPQGIPVITSGGDQQNSALGLGQMDDSSLVINCGTGSFILSLCDEPELTNSTMICNISAVPGKYTIESNVLASAAALNWLIREIFPDEWHRGKIDFETFNDIAASSPIGANGVICVPLFQGCGTRHWNNEARASFSHISLGNTRADLARAMYEGIAAEIAKSIMAMPKKVREADTVYIGGGMTKCDFFDQILADMTGKKLLRYSDTQATAIGAFMNAAVHLGIYDSLYEAFAAVRKESVPYTFTPIRDHIDFYQNYLEETERIFLLVNG